MNDPVQRPRLHVGLAGATRNACVALAADRRIVGICEQERITRARGAGFNPTGLPDEVLDELLGRYGATRRDVTTFSVAEDLPRAGEIEFTRLDPHFAQACAAYFASPYDSATIIVCDREAPHLSLWDGRDTGITRIAWPWEGTSFAGIYSECAEALGFTGGGHEQRMEAMARLDPTHRDGRADRLFTLADSSRLQVAHEWQAAVADWAREARHPAEKSGAAAALQARVGDLLLEFLRAVKRRIPQRGQLCVSGSLFANSHFNALLRSCGVFEDVFVPVNPGRGGLAVGAVLHASGGTRQPVTPFLGPSYSAEEIKATLDNCKLTYQWASESDIVGMVLQALQKGRLVALFDGPMEWGPRALGARSILANPFVPYVLDNLNQFLKRRDMWRGYALSGLEADVREHFEGPARSPYMECDFVPRDRSRFRHILPGPSAHIRVQTVGSDAPCRFRTLLQAFGDAVGAGLLVNTSFNGTREPIVCSPSDAVRVFFGSGLDLLVLGDFIVSK
jgi:carbamoyltransferase